jgi:predicted PurR-regulated permease PerM
VVEEPLDVAPATGARRAPSRPRARPPALGSQGTTGALILGVVALLANGVLQQLIQPFVMGATLGLNPLVVLVVTIGAGALFGMVGLTLAAPLTSAAVHISNELRDRSGRSEGAEPVTAPSG